jgi:hypothetical protein
MEKDSINTKVFFMTAKMQTLKALSILRGLEPAEWRQALLKAWPDMPEETLADVVRAKKILDKN